MLNDPQIEILIARFFSGESSPEEAMQLEDWIMKSAVNKSYFDGFSALFTLHGNGNEKQGKLYAWELIKTAISKKDDQPGIQLARWPWRSIAASLILIMTIGFGAYTYFKKANKTITFGAEFSSRKIVLNDSSSVIIAPNSFITISKDFGSTERRITLTGSAYFSVIHDPDKLFIVDINQLHIKDMGTKFSIFSSLNNDTVFINVHEGSVSVYDDFEAEENASAGEKIIYIRPLKKIIAIYPKQTKHASDSAGKTKNKPSRETVEIKSRAPAAQNTTPGIIPPAVVTINDSAEDTAVKQDSLKGAVLFECSGCAEKAMLEFVSGTDKTRTKSNFSFIINESPTLYVHKEFLKPGEYNWFYSDQNNRKTKGIVRVKANEQVKVILFEFSKSKSGLKTEKIKDSANLQD